MANCTPFKESGARLEGAAGKRRKKGRLHKQGGLEFFVAPGEGFEPPTG